MIFTNLEDWSTRTRPVQDIINEVQAQFFQIPGVFVFASNPPAFGFGNPVNFVIQHPDFDSLSRGNDTLLARARQIKGLVNVDSDLRVNKPQLEVNFDRDRAEDLGVPVGDVLSSPTYRALQTVKFAGLGTAKTTQELGDGGTSMDPQTVSAWASWLKTKVAEPPRAGTDTFIVSHSPNITSAFADDAKGIADGEALVFHPDGKGGAELVAHIKIEEWPQLAR